MSAKLKFPIRLLIYLVIFAGVVFSSFYWGSPGQKKNMNQANQEIQALQKELSANPRFAEVKISSSTRNLGRDILVQGNIPDRKALNDLKSLLSRSISPKFQIFYERLEIDMDLPTSAPAKSSAND